MWNRRDHKKLYRVALSLLGDNRKAALIWAWLGPRIAWKIQTFFMDKITAIRASGTELWASSSNGVSFDELIFRVDSDCIHCCSCRGKSEKRRVSGTNKVVCTCVIRCNTHPVCWSSAWLLPLITPIINISLAQSEFLSTFNHAIVWPLIKILSLVWTAGVSVTIAWCQTVKCISLPTGDFIPRS